MLGFKGRPRTDEEVAARRMAALRKKMGSSVPTRLSWDTNETLLRDAVKTGWGEGIVYILERDRWFNAYDRINRVFNAQEVSPELAGLIIAPLMKEPSSLGPYQLLTWSKGELLLGLLPHFKPEDLSPRARTEIVVNILEQPFDSRSLSFAKTWVKAGILANHNDGEPLYRALLNNHFDLAAQMIEDGFSADLYAQFVYKRLSDAGADKAAIDFIKPLLAPVAAVLETSGFVSSGPDGVAIRQPLPDGGYLTMVFNFALAQQVVLAQTRDAVGAMAVVPFSQIESREALRDAARAYVEQGGDPARVEIWLSQAAIAKPQVL